jgi:hypothetical protein
VAERSAHAASANHARREDGGWRRRNSRPKGDGQDALAERQGLINAVAGAQRRDK